MKSNPKSQTKSRGPRKARRKNRPRSAQLQSPPALRRGDTIAIVQPAGKLDPDAYQRTKSIIQEQGLFVAEWKGSRSSHSYFSASDAERKDELSWALREPGIRAVFCARGGYGCVRMLSEGLLSEKKFFQPKIVTGYSDITYLHQWIQNHLQWISFHSNLVGMIGDEALARFVEQILDLPTTVSHHLMKQKWEGAKVLQAGVAKGKLVGGNLSLLRLQGPAALPQENVVLAIEDVNEDYYALDRLLWTLIDSGYSRYVKALLVGRLKNCGERDASRFPLEELQATARRLCQGPILWGAEFGHGLDEQLVLPLGAELQVIQNALEFREPWVEER